MAPPGNTNGRKKDTMISDGLRRALLEEDSRRVRQICTAIAEKAAQGDLSCAVWIADRVEGKAGQAFDLNLSGDVGLSVLAADALRQKLKDTPQT